MVNSKATALSLAVSALSLAGGADAFWRLPCRGRTGVGRLDPIMDPGKVSDHVHVVHGGSNFGIGNTPQDLLDSDCTSCAVTQDKSAYWVPPLYFIHADGKAEMVEQVGGMLVYYLLYTDNGPSQNKITAFPDGFQMIAGDKMLRNFTGPVPDPDWTQWTSDMKSQFSLGQKAIGFNCMNYAAQPEASLYRHFLPDKDYLDSHCTDGVRIELMFPSCWNGKDLDSHNHRSHMAYPDRPMGGTCPEDFPVRVPSLFFEIIFNTHAFAGVDGQFVLSQGDPTGYGMHGDFQMGWDSADFLQSAVDTCTNPSGVITDCPLFNIITDEEQQQCSFKDVDIIKDDNPLGPRNGLPINIPIQVGPEYATKYPVVLANLETQVGNLLSALTAKPTSVVPTLSYAAGTSSKTDMYGGGILAVNTDSSYTPESTSATSTTSFEQKQPILSTVTASASVDNAAPVDPNVVATSYITSGNQVIEMVIAQTDITVTATATATASVNANARRHLEQHQNRRARGHPRH